LLPGNARRFFLQSASHRGILQACVQRRYLKYTETTAHKRLI
jgi:hypothetical protein